MNHSSYMIREMPPTDRPRERLWELGADKLKKEELIAILLRTGIKGVSAVDVAQQLLHDHGHSLDSLARVTAQRLAQHKGSDSSDILIKVYSKTLPRYVQASYSDA